MSMITLSIQIDQELARCLGGSAAANFIAQQPDRFAVMALDGADSPAHDDIAPLLDKQFEGGVMTWLGSLTEALILRAFEQASGYRTAVLSDECLAGVPLNGPGGGYADAYVVLSSRHNDTCCQGCARC